MLLDVLASAFWPPNDQQSCCTPEDHAGPELLLTRPNYDHEGNCSYRCEPYNCDLQLAAMTEDEVRLNDHWSEASRRRSRSRTTFCAIVEGDDDFELEDHDHDAHVGFSPADSRTLEKGMDSKVQQNSTKSTTLPPESLKRTIGSETKEDASPKTPGSRAGLSRSSKSSFSSLSSNARRAAATRAAMAGLNISMDDPDEPEVSGRQGGVITRAVSRILRAGSSLSSILGGSSRHQQRVPTLTSISQRRTLASMVSLRLNSPQLLRATRAYKPLVSFGAVLRDRRSTRVGFGRSMTTRDPQARAQREDSFDDYMMSFQTRFIDQFWSHSWRANTALKVMVLLLYYNQASAVFLSIVVGGVAVALRASRILPYFVELESVLGAYSYAAWTTIFGTAAFAVVLVTWRPRQRVFLDKVCIHQKDPVLKKEGVESIGAFLYHSKTMLVLWDPSYAQRLWCVFEMAAFAWAHRNDLKNRVEIRPVIFAPVYFGLMTASLINWALIFFFPKTLTFSLTLWPAVQSFITILGVHSLRSFHRDMTILRQHLAEFQVDKAQCYCCSVNHRLPETGEKIACDREVIQACIMTWFGSLSDFDSFVQAELAGYFWRSLGHFGLPYRWVVGSQLPVFWAYMDLIAEAIPQADKWEVFALMIEALTMWLCASPLVVAFVIWVTNWLQRKRACRLCDALVSAGAALLTLVPFLTMTFLWYLSRFAISTNPLPGAVVFLIVSAEMTTLTFKWGRLKCLDC
ncbi:Uncharacterized protein SCF082_LOCUS14319 [Durusdinium trenchii]|uniref:Transmembrane protein n=1 Tax=Durusdinium trenchii TaxID=1381693 RepID=A0ABP0JYF6_9DINO